MTMLPGPLKSCHGCWLPWRMNVTEALVRTSGYVAQKPRPFDKGYGDILGRSIWNGGTSIVQLVCTWTVACRACLVEQLPTDQVFFETVPSLTDSQMKNGSASISSMRTTIILSQDGLCPMANGLHINITNRQKSRLLWKITANS